VKEHDATKNVKNTTSFRAGKRSGYGVYKKKELDI